MVRIRPMTADDLADGLRLSEQAGWNQTRDDWSRWLGLQPDGCFVGDWEGRVSATVTTCLFGPVGWIAMMLVDPSLRGQGIGRALMTQALAFLESRGARTIRLDATPLGQPLYESLGFVGEYRLARHGGIVAAARVEGSGEPVGPNWEGRLLALDREVTGTDRGKLLRKLLAEAPESCRVMLCEGQVAGFAMQRPGRRATQIGPCIASPEVGVPLLAGTCDRLAGRPIILDIPVGHWAAEMVAVTRGLAVQRTLLRMSRGESALERPGWLWASSGPEMG